MKIKLLLFALLFAAGNAHSQLIINEFSQGNSGTREYFELVVTGTRTCTDSTADIRGWVFDDHNGWYGGGSTGIATGHLRFANNPVWQDVPYGSIILLYNSGDKNGSITLADDPTDANNDHVYVIPVSSSSTVIESFSGAPTSPSSPTYIYPTTGYSSASNNWNYLGLSNTGDGIVLARPSNLGVAAHSVIFFTGGGAPFQVPNVQLSNVAGSRNAYLSDAAYNSAASWVIGSAGVNETPGLPNGGANTTWINGMRIQRTPPAPTSFSASICSGDSYTFNGIGRTTTGPYTATFNSGGCDSVVTLNLTVNPRPVLTAPAVTQPTCAGNNGSITLNGLTASTAYTITYTSPAGPVSLAITSTPAGTIVLPNLSAGTYSNFVASIGTCLSNPAGPVTLTNAPAPATPVITTNTPQCAGGTLNLSTPVVPGATYDWTGPNGFISTLPNPSITNVNFNGGGTYYLTITVGGCMSPQASAVVVITQPPVRPVAASNPSGCAGDTLKLFATSVAGATSYNWTGPGGYTSAVQNPFIANSTGAMSGYYVVYASAGNCQSGKDSVLVTVKPRPAAPTASNNTPVCEGDQVNLTATGTPGATFTWSGPGSFASTQQNPSLTATTAAGGAYQVFATLAGCASLPTTTVVTVTTRPVINTPVLVSPTACGGTNGSITLTGLTANAVYQVVLVKNGVPATSNLQATGTGTLVFPGLTSGTYSITGITYGGCTSLPAGPFVLSDPSAPAAPAVTSNAPICEGATLQLTANGLAGATYLWGGPLGFTSTSRTPTIPNAAPAAGGMYTVTQSLNGCTSAGATINVTVNAQPATPVLSSNSPVCSGDTVKLSATSATTGVTYAWTGTGGFSSTLQNPVIANAPAGTTTYTLTTSAGGCASAAATITVTVNQTPAAATLVSNSPVCSGSTLTIQAVPQGTGLTTYTWTGPGGYTSAAQTVSIPNVTSANSGTYTVRISRNGCSSLPAGALVVVNPTPAIATATGTNPSGCATPTGSITLTGLAASTVYTLNYTKDGVPASATLTADGSGNVVIPNLTAATYGNIVALAGNCASAPAGPVTLADPNGPPAPVAGNNGPLCSGGTLNLTATTVAGAAYTWTGPNGFTSNVQSPVITNAPVAAGGTYRVTVRVGSCASVPATTTVTINQTPDTATITSNSPVCVGNTLTLNASSTAGATFTWTGPNSFTSSVANPSIASVTTAAGGLYTVTAQLGSCAALPVSRLITVVPIPAAPLASPVVYCQDAPALPLTAAGTNLLFYTAATGGTGVTSLVPSTAATGTFTYYVSQSAGNCEGPRAPVSVTVNPKPAPPVVTTSYSFCQFSTAGPLTATGTGIRWFSTPTGTLPLPVAPTPNTQVVGTSVYYVSSKSGDCESDRIKVTVEVNPKPAPPTVVSPVRLCQYDTVELKADGQDLRWYLHPTGGGGMPVLIPNTGNVDSFTYYVTQTISGCESDRTEIRVLVNYKPNGIILASRPFVCAGDTLSFNYYGNARPDAEYNWKTPLPQSTVIGGGGQGPLVVRFDSSGLQYVQLTINNMGCLSGVFGVPVTVRPLPQPAFVLQPEGCIDGIVNVALSGITGAIDSFKWDFNNGRVHYSTATGGPFGVSWNSAGSKVVSVTATSKTCGSRVYRDTILIRPNPDARISRAGNGVVCTGDSVELSVVNEPGSTYAWEPYQYFTDRARMGSVVFATPNRPGVIRVSVRSSAGCSSGDSIYIDTKPCCRISFPNAFSPNGDGKNDLFRAVTVGHHDIATFRIVNRWGQVVYESNEEQRGWDGTFNGRDQDLGTYYFYLKYRCSDSGDYLEQKGELMLVR